MLLTAIQYVLLRFGAEEDAIRAKVDQYDRGGKAIVETLMDTWTQRLGHEQKILADDLEAEREVLTLAAPLVAEKHLGGAWRAVILDGEVIHSVQQKGAKLAGSIQALMLKV